MQYTIIGIGETTSMDTKEKQIIEKLINKIKKGNSLFLMKDSLIIDNILIGRCFSHEATVFSFYERCFFEDSRENYFLFSFEIEDDEKLFKKFLNTYLKIIDRLEKQDEERNEKQRQRRIQFILESL